MKWKTKHWFFERIKLQNLQAVQSGGGGGKDTQHEKERGYTTESIIIR